MRRESFFYLLVFGMMVTIIGLGYKGKYVGPGNSSLILIITGLSITLPCLAYYLYQRHIGRKKLAEQENAENDRFQEFLETSDKSVLELRDVELVSFDGKDIETYETLVSQIEDEGRNHESTSRKVSIRFPYKGRKVAYSFDTHRNLSDIRIHFELKKYTDIYEKNGDIYVDTSFLE